MEEIISQRHKMWYLEGRLPVCLDALWTPILSPLFLILCVSRGPSYERDGHSVLPPHTPGKAHDSIGSREEFIKCIKT